MTVTEPSASRTTEILSRPVRINGLTVPNRIVMAPMTRKFSPGGVPGENVRSYYARRAAAGVGLIVTEGTYVGHESAGQSDDVPRFRPDVSLDLTWTHRGGGWERSQSAAPAGSA